MRKIIHSLFLLVFAGSLYSQVVRVSIAPTLSNAFYFQMGTGGYSTDAKLGIGASLEYIKSQDTRFSIGYGIDFQHSNLEIIPASTGEPIETHNESINVLSANFKTVYNMNKVIFLTVNPLIGLQLPSESQNTVDNQTGFGLSFSGGIRLEVTENLDFSFEPIIWVYNIIPFKYQYLPERLTVVGIKFGFSLKH